MPLSVRTEEFSPAFEDAFLDAVRARRAGEAVVVVPSHLVGVRLTRRYAARFGGAYGLRFWTPGELATRILEKDAASLPPPFPVGARARMIAEVLAALPTDHRFHPVRDKPGFAKGLLRYFSAATLRNVADRPDVAGVRRAFAARVGDAFIDEAECVARASRVAAAPGAELFAYGFYEVPAMVRALLEGVAVAREVSLWALRLPAEPAPSGAVAFSSHADPRAEAAAAVRRVVADHAAGTALEAMAIVVPQAGSIPLYEGFLETAGLPYYRPGGKPILEMPEGYGFARLLDHLEEPGDRRDLLEIWGSLRFHGEAIVGAAADWDEWTRVAGLSRGDDAAGARRRWEALEAKDPDARRASFAAWFAAWTDDLAALRGSHARWEEAAAVFAGFAKARFAATPANQALFEILQGLGDMDRTGVAPEFPTVLAVLRERLERASLPRGLFAKRGLYLGTARGCQAIPFAIVHVAGFTQDVYPRRTFVPEWMGGAETGDEDLTAYASLFRQAARLDVSYPRADFLGKALHPSPWIARIKQASGLAVAHEPLLPWTRPPAAPLSPADWIETGFARALRGAAPQETQKLARLAPWFRTVADWVEDRLGSAAFGPCDGRAAPEGRLARERFSAKHVSDAARCAYQHFLRTILELRAPGAPEDVTEIESLDRGNLIHAILFRLFDRLRALGLFPLRREKMPEVFALLDETAAAAFAGVEAATHVGLQNLWRHEQSSVRADLRAFLAAELARGDGYVPAAFEVRFGMKSRSEDEDRALSTDAPVRAPISGATLSLYGKIDRLDRSPDQKRVRVIDYKTGMSVRVKDDAFTGGTSVQLPIYLLAVRHLFPDVDPEACEATLLSTSAAGGFDTASFSGRALVARQEDLTQILDTVHDLHRRGFFPPNPGPGMQNCEICEFRPVCGRAVERIFERKRDDPEAAPYLELGDIA